MPSLLGLLAGAIFAYFLFFANKAIEDWVLYSAVVVGYFAALLGDENRPRSAWVGWFANSVAFWSVLMLVIRAGGPNLVITAVVSIALALLLLAAWFMDFLDRDASRPE
jgi:hypothetical protein